MELRPVRLSDPEVAPLLTGLAAEYETRYGPNDELSTTGEEEFQPPQGLFLALMSGETIVAGGGYRRLSADACEVKRMWTHSEHRRHGHASTVLNGLEDAARHARVPHDQTRDGTPATRGRVPLRVDGVPEDRGVRPLLGRPGL